MYLYVKICRKFMQLMQYDIQLCYVCLFLIFVMKLNSTEQGHLSSASKVWYSLQFSSWEKGQNVASIGEWFLSRDNQCACRGNSLLLFSVSTFSSFSGGNSCIPLVSFFLALSNLPFPTFASLVSFHLSEIFVTLMFLLFFENVFAFVFDIQFLCLFLTFFGRRLKNLTVIILSWNATKRVLVHFISCFSFPSISLLLVIPLYLFPRHTASCGLKWSHFAQSSN